MALLIVAGSVLVVSLGTGFAQGPESGAGDATAPISSEEVRNLAYPNEFTESETASLADGYYSEPAAPISASDVIVQFRRAAFGTIAGQPAAAVVLSTNAGGSGTFYALHIVLRSAGGAPEPIAQHSLGDRIVLQGVAFAGEAIQVDFTGFAADDGLCCPTLNMARDYRVRNGRLELERAHEAPALLAIPEGGSLIGWFGGPTTSSAILASAPPLAGVWGYDPVDDTWMLDARELPREMRQMIPAERGIGLFVVARSATEIPVPLLPAPAACPLNPGPPNPIDPSMIVERPGNGELLSGAVPIAGRARAFEANVRIRVLAADGVTLVDTHTTAEVGGPWFGDFAAEIPVTVTEETAACVQVFEQSPVDGSQVNVVQIGVVLRPAP